MTGREISSELSISVWRGMRVATFLAEEEHFDNQSMVTMTLAVHAYSSNATEPGDGAQMDLQLSTDGEEREKSDEHPFGGHEHIALSATLNKAQARALRDQITAFLAYE